MASDLGQHSVELSAHLLVGEAQDSVAQTLQFGLALPVVFNLESVNIAIHFDDEIACEAAEVHNVPGYGLLATKLGTELFAPQGTPEFGLRRSRSLAHSPGVG